MFKIIQRQDKNRCYASHCFNRNRGSRDRFCSKHRHRYNKLNDPRKYTYNLLKSNANKRHIFFNLTFEEFVEFCNETRYMETKGRKAKSMTIDRVIVELGYTKGNLQVLTKVANSVKRHAVDYPIDNMEVPF